MLDERSLAYAVLREAAESAIGRPEEAAKRVIGPGTGLLTFSIAVQPSFEPSLSFALLSKPARSGNPVRRVCRVLWNASEDLRRVEAMNLAALRLRPLEPTIDVRVVDAPPEVEEWLRELLATRVPPALAGWYGGLDGTVTTVRFGHALQHSEFRWWCEGPQEWTALTDWASRTTASLGRLFQDSPSGG